MFLNKPWCCIIEEEKDRYRTSWLGSNCCYKTNPQMMFRALALLLFLWQRAIAWIGSFTMLLRWVIRLLSTYLIPFFFPMTNGQSGNVELFKHSWVKFVRKKDSIEVYNGAYIIPHGTKLEHGFAEPNNLLSNFIPVVYHIVIRIVMLYFPLFFLSTRVVHMSYKHY